MKPPSVLFVCVLVVCRLETTRPHGMLLVPPQRSSMFREGFDVPANYDDNGLNCGGITNQFNVNGGKCGVCGDPYQGPFPNEIGGKYATGIIGRTYVEGELISVVVKVTANHLGYFEFRLCPLDSRTPRVTQSCLDHTLLKIQDGHDWTTKYYPGSRKGEFSIRVKLPDGLTCTRCVMQWTYRAGNNWDCSKEEGCCKGCGPQEHFINCADIAITSTSATQQRPLNTTQHTTTPPPPSSSVSTTSVATSSTMSQATPTSSCREKTGWEHIYPWCRTNCALGYCPRSHCTCDGDVSDPYDNCRAVGVFTGNEAVDNWCVVNCRMGVCPGTLCSCS
ncbi:uncharacterized protein LOC121390010 [Gigantopelta aegis]|uniref:uncharacterized protein LOC121390010 n=1 Tax=Gigantopelta aegis TaxID=1735272 RepID=UPI001B888EAC|nr:uncharacterized protein LOC121390010 [Gigantopelta aegis]